MPGNSVTILTSQVHPEDSTVKSVTGDKQKADGYFGRSDGFHTVQINLTEFTGEIAFQGSLAITPSDTDWFSVEISSTTDTTVASVDTTGAITSATTTTLSSVSLSDESSNLNYNFTGNYVWIRAVVTNWTSGSIKSILMNF